MIRIANRFPLKLAAFEEFFLYKDRDSHPSTFFCSVLFSQPLDRKVAELATQVVGERHPLATSIVNTTYRTPSWSKSVEPIAIDWVETPVSIADLQQTQIDIERRPGLRIFAFDGNADATLGGINSVITFVVHHVAFDGLGFLQFLKDWIQCYRSISRTSLEQARLDFPVLQIPRRCRPNVSFGESLRLLPGQWKSVRATIQVLKRKVIPLTSGVTTHERQPSPLFASSLRLSSTQTRALKRYAKSKGASLNSVLLRDLFTTIVNWKKQEGNKTPGTHLRLMVPINERTKLFRKMAACNHCTMINLDRTPMEIGDETELLQGIEQELGVIAKWKLSLNFWRALEVFRWLPGGLNRFAGDEVSATMLLTNVGRILPKLMSKAGTEEQELAIEDFEVLPPLAFGTAAAMAACYVKNELRIAFQFDETLVSPKDFERLVTLYNNKLQANISHV